MKRTTKIKLSVLAGLLLLNLVMNLFGNLLQIERYTLHSDKLTQPVRIVFISDLHNCTYGGSDQSEIWAKIQEEQPDLVLFGGDVIDMQGGTRHALKLMEMALKSYPCAYTAGNHEAMRDDTDAFYEEVKALGMPILHGDSLNLTVNGQDVRIAGFPHAYDNPQEFSKACGAMTDDGYTILLAHQPEQLGDIQRECKKHSTGADLILSGHAHGGQWRIPKFLEHGLFAPEQGIFPAFTCGQREADGTVQIVSRGLAKPLRMWVFPRICNRPELTVVEISPTNGVSQ